jgi:uncharacterized membrane protein YhaH (DUF805 family)
MRYMFMPLARYADFSGRSRRREFWLWQLFNLIVTGILTTLLLAMFFAAAYRVAERGGATTTEYSSYADSETGFGYSSGSSVQLDPVMFMEEFGAGGLIVAALLGIYALFIFIPNLAVTIRRLHDQDKSGWFILLGLLPIANLVLLVFMFLDGTRGPNRFGPPPY